MLAPLLSLVLAVPFSPQVQAPAPEGWTVGTRAEFNVGPYADDAGIAAAEVRLEFRREDAGYGTMSETFPFSSYVYPTLQFPVEGTRWCWKARHLNTQSQISEPSAERCFRTDFAPPVNGALDGGAIVSDGFVALDLQPATDNLSGVRGYFLDLAPSPTGPFDTWHAFDQQLPLETFVGEGVWFGQVRAADNAGNVSQGDVVVPITITASPSVPTPEPPSFARPVVNGYGDLLLWDGGWMADAGITHVVASYCNLDAGCEWRHAFHGYPVASSTWLQVDGEGAMIARIAVVQGGQVGPWSQPSSTPLLVDRTPPSKPGPASSLPAAARMGPLSVSWGAATDDFTGVAQYVVQLTEQLSGRIATTSVNAPTLSTSTTVSSDGRYLVRVAAVDVAGNQGEFSDSAISVIDSTGPRAGRPTAVATAIDGGALVSITWTLPTDALSSVTTMELNELAVDGGAQLVSVTGLSASRTVPPGQWRWQLRGTDSLGNVGNFSDPSNLIIVTEQGVVNGPSITTNSLSARCGEPLLTHLVGSGDEPRTWTLLSGPQGLEVTSAGQLTWTSPLVASVELLQVQLSNAAGAVNGEVKLEVTCDATDGGVALQKQLLVGCGCSSFDPLFPLMLLALLIRRRMSHS